MVKRGVLKVLWNAQRDDHCSSYRSVEEDVDIKKSSLEDYVVEENMGEEREKVEEVEEEVEDEEEKRKKDEGGNKSQEK